MTLKGSYGLSRPEVAFVIFDPVFLEESNEFLLEGLSFIVFLLVSDVFLQGLHGGLADGKGSIPVLPAEAPELRALGFDPF
jgi:hypothetical protein